MSGQWWENDLIVGPFADLDAAKAWAAANQSLLFPGLLATAGGVTVMWANGAWTNPNSPYVGSTIPASGQYIGQLIQVDNAAVPGGCSNLRWNGTLWAPPMGELIAQEGNYTTVLASLALPDTNANVVYTGPIIPDYMIPDGIKFGFLAVTTMRDSVTAIGGGSIGGTLSAVAANIASSGSVMQYSRIQIGNASASEWGSNNDMKTIGRRVGANMKTQYHSWPSSNDGQNTQPGNQGTFVAGAMAARFAAKGQTTQTASVWAYEIVSHGAL